MYTVLVFACLAVALGLPGLLARQPAGRRASWRRAVALAGVFAVLGGALAVAGQPSFLWLPFLLLVPVWLLFAVCRSGLITSGGLFFTRLLEHVRFQAALLLLGGGALLGWQSYSITCSVEQELADTDDILSLIAAVPNLEDSPSFYILTDAGQRIPLFRATDNDADGSRLEKEYLHQRGYDAKIIQTGDADVSYNCHGWVFAGGKGWVRGSFVDQILTDNRYQTVSRPVPGDVAVFRDRQGVVSHTALVRSVFDDGTVLLESKWGKLGRFIHTSTQHVYAGDSLGYYRSPRPSHVVNLKDL